MSRKFIITDIHGCAATFRKLVQENIRLSPDDDLYLLGDYIDRGPDSKGVLDFIFELKEKGHSIHCLRGNHEEFLLYSLKDPDELEHWKTRNGGNTTLRSFEVDRPNDIPDKYLSFISQLPYFLEVDDFLLVHAGFNFDADNPFEDRQAMLMIRNFRIDRDFLKGRKIIHGHTPTRLSQIIANVENSDAVEINLDAGCVYHSIPDLNYLVALELNTWKLFVEEGVDRIS